MEGSYSPAQVTSVWRNISSEFKLDHKTQTVQVQKEIRKLMADKQDFNRILQSATPYIYFIYQQTQAYGLPAELALIPFIESEYNPNDHSNAGALGLWQLMPGTARDLGVRVQGGYDGRRNIIDSTDAALAYFRDLGNLFKGNWYLAIAAYNSGEGKVLSAKRRIGSTDFFKMPLPRETQLYVPKLLAVAEIVEHPDKYGVKLPAVKNEPYFTKVEVSKPVTLDKVAEVSGTPKKELQRLNPDVKPGNTVTASKKGNTPAVLVPVNKAASVNV
ncbi:MAG TPA: transglycosylase SLT domain-containing protein [Gammaproteobacteria bacterium]|nr:transglycosylase SLT domain-containing protein [Gammaproteobacteria bacterium]